MKSILQFSTMVLLCLSLAPYHSLLGQRSGNSTSTNLQPVSQTYAITGATIIQSPGKQLDQGTILIKDGLIVSVGSDVDIPGEAQVIKVDSMYVYAGFIDGMSHTGIPKPKAASAQQTGNRSRGQSRSDSANPPNKDAGIQPEQDVKDVLDPKDGSIGALRKLGFTAAHVVPRGKMLPGTGSIILLTGNSPDEMVFRAQSSLFSQFVTASGVYPNTIMGIMAKWRDLYRQAELARTHESSYAQKPAGMKRPAYDRVIQAFYPTINGDRPVFFKAEKALEAYRALALAEDLGFPIVLTGLQQGWDLTSKLQSANTPVFLSLDLPKAPKSSDKKKEKESDLSEIEKETMALTKRKAEAYKQSCSQAATFAQAGISFGLSSEGAKVKDIPANLRTMIKHGLSEEAALAALTTNPAQMLGVSDVMGTVEVGKLANLVISNNSYFAEKSNVRYVFVEGVMHEIEAPKPKKKSGAAPTAQAVGKWNYTVETPQGSSSGLIIIKGEDGNYSGTISNEMMGADQELSEVDVSGDELTFSFSFDNDGQTMSIQVTGTIEDTDMEGVMELGGFGEAPFEAQRTGDPE
ncbi:MAG: amidohydrolase family protein [Bacteroidota bacterium]